MQNACSGHFEGPISRNLGGFDEKSKIDPNDPQMAWGAFGGVFGVFSPYFEPVMRILKSNL